MAGGVPYDERKMLALVAMILDERGRRTSHEEIAHWLFHIDFGAYRRLGTSITGATYVKGRP
jgi:hypothetical protein